MKIRVDRTGVVMQRRAERNRTGIDGFGAENVVRLGSSEQLSPLCSFRINLSPWQFSLETWLELRDF